MPGPEPDSSTIEVHYALHMKATALQVKIKARDDNLLVGRLASTMYDLHASLRDIERGIAPQEPRTQWVVKDAERRRSDLLLLLSPRIDGKQTFKSAGTPIEGLVDGARSLVHSPELPAYYSDRIVNRMMTAGRLSGGVEGISLATVNGSVGAEVALSGSFLANAKNAIRGTQQGWGVVVGILDILDSRHPRSGIRASLLDENTKRGVSINVPSERTDALKALWNSRVLVGGPLKRNERGQAVSMTLEYLESYSGYDDVRLDASSLCGIAPDWTDGMDPIDWVRAIRREAQEISNGS